MTKLLTVLFLLAMTLSAYAVPLQNGVAVYTDRDYTWTDVGPYAGYEFIQTANDDKTLPLTISGNGEFYLAVDTRTQAPDGWAPTGETVDNSDSNATFAVFVKSLNKGISFSKSKYIARIDDVITMPIVPRQLLASVRRVLRADSRL